MSDRNGEAAELAERAARQGKQAGKNAARAAKAVAEDVADTVVDETRDTLDKLEQTGEDVMGAARRVNPRTLSRISGDTGMGFLALSVSLYTGAVAISKFRAVYAGRSSVID
jgi:hypothetical protein